MVSAKDEINPFKALYAVDMLLVLISLSVIWTNPSHSEMAEYYAWGQLGVFLVILADIWITIEILDTVTIEVGNPKYLFSRLKVPIGYVLMGSVLLGLIVGAYYYDRVLSLRKVYLVIPRFFSTQPTLAPIGQVIDARTFDAFSSSYPVSAVEDTMWFGLLLPTMLGLIWLGLMKIEVPDLPAWIISALICIPTVSYAFSYIGHNSSYGGNLVAFQDAFNYGLYCSTSVTLSGNLLPCRFAHTLHNWAGTILYYEQNYQSVTQPQGFIQYPSSYPSYYG